MWTDQINFQSRIYFPSFLIVFQIKHVILKIQSFHVILPNKMAETRVAYDWTMWSVGVKTIKDVITYRIYFCFILYI